MIKIRVSAFGFALSMHLVALVSASAPLRAQNVPAAAPITRTVASVLQWGPCPSIFPTGCQIAVLNGDPSKPNADVFLRVPSGYIIPSHLHTSSERMILVEGRLTIRYKGAAAASLTPGEYAYGPAGLPHGGQCSGGTSCTLFIAFDGPVDAMSYAGSLK